MPIYDYLLSGFCYLISILLFVNMRGIPDSDSRLLPIVTAIILIVLATGNILYLLITKKKQEYSFSGSKRAIIVLLMLFAYILLVSWLGIYICTPFFIVGTMLVMGQRDKKALIISPVATTLGIWLIFGVLFSIQLPTGSLFVGLF